MSFLIRNLWMNRLIMGPNLKRLALRLSTCRNCKIFTIAGLINKAAILSHNLLIMWSMEDFWILRLILHNLSINTVKLANFKRLPNRFEPQSNSLIIFSIFCYKFGSIKPDFKMNWIKCIWWWILFTWTVRSNQSNFLKKNSIII
jgi:hypothetical protein